MNIPNRDFLPSELDNLIEAFEIASRINMENKNRYRMSRVEESGSELAEYIEIIDKRDFAKIGILSTGEMVNVNIPERLIAPSEAKGLLEDLKAVKHKMEELSSKKRSKNRIEKT